MRCWRAEGVKLRGRRGDLVVTPPILPAGIPAMARVDR
jgi:hypothetical protein